MRRRVSTWFAGMIAGLIVIASGVQIAEQVLAWEPEIGLLLLVNRLAWLIFPVVAGVTAALIIAHQPRNTIGWLLLVPALLMSAPEVFIVPIDPLVPPQSPSVAFLLYLWFDNWSWILLIFPLLFIPLLFPDGRLPSPRWRWVLALAGAMALVMLGLSGLVKEIAPINTKVQWTIQNPIGVIDTSWFSLEVFSIVWSICLLGLTAVCISALFVRYRRADAAQRAQIRWLLYACAIFGVVYAFMGWEEEKTPTYYLLDLLFVLSLTGLPLAIAAAILRHRLFDIDLLIRKTLVYAALTGLLGLTFAGSVILLQGLFTALTGNQSEAAVVISTLGMAALFTPLRSRIQRFIDRRFFRAKYNAETLLADFARTTRDETDLNVLSARLAGVVQNTMQPETTSLWLKRK